MTPTPTSATRNSTRQTVDPGPALQRLRVDLAYDGAPFFGFARQPGRPTVQGTLEDALSGLLGQPVRTTCAGRTDRGVHARAQVIHLDVDMSEPRAARALADLDRWRYRLDRTVGDAITVWRVRRVPSTFDARFSATAREYRYRLVDSETVDPLRRHDRWVVGDRLDVPAMRAGAALLVGEHDFASFCRRAPGRTTTRRLDEIAISRRLTDHVEVRLKGTAFCHQQVRAIVGCLVEVGGGRREPGWIREVLRARDRSTAARVAPPHGLTLERVVYGRRAQTGPVGPRL